MSRCNTCKYDNLPWYEEPCDSCCGAHDGYEPKENNMSRYIDADKLKQHYAWIRYADSETADMFDNIIDQQPTADVRENVRGEWIEITDHEIPIVCKCTECGWLTKDYEAFAFCPNCGADMRSPLDNHFKEALDALDKL